MGESHQQYALEHALPLLELRKVLPRHIGEPPLLADNDLLTAWELVAGTAERLLDDGRVRLLAADAEDDLADVHTRDSAVRFAPSATHTSLQPIGPCA